ARKYLNGKNITDENISELTVAQNSFYNEAWKYTLPPLSLKYDVNDGDNVIEVTAVYAIDGKEVRTLIITCANEEGFRVLDEVNYLPREFTAVISEVYGNEQLTGYEWQKYVIIPDEDSYGFTKGEKTLVFSRPNYGNDFFNVGDKVKVQYSGEPVTSFTFVGFEQPAYYFLHLTSLQDGQPTEDIPEDIFDEATDEPAENAALSVQNVRKLADTYGYSGTLDKKAVEMLVKIYEASCSDGELLPDMLSASHYDMVLQKIKGTLAVGKEYSLLCTEISDKFEKSILDYPAAEARMRRKQAESSWFIPKALGLGKLVKELKLHAKDPSSVKKTDLAEILDKLCIISEKKDILRSVPSDITSILTGLYMNEQTDWNTLEKAVMKTDSVMNAIKVKSDAVPADISKKLGTADCDKEGQALVSYFDKLESFRKEFCTDMRSVENEADWLNASSAKFHTYVDNADKLRYIAEFNSADIELAANDLSCISESYRCGRINAENIEAAYSCCLNYQLALSIIHSDVRLKEFSSNSCNDLIVQFRDTIDKFSRLTMQELAARLSAKIPASGTASAATSEMGILKRAIKSNGRMMSLRSLFDKIPNLLRKLCPCMLMSPISVAQYIDPSFPKFDLVIFDEASQLPTAEAAGTIARGENVVIVGDPKQLPPTNFFSSNRIDEENSEKEDLESLLDDCLAISMPQRYLKWHYRSRHESLISYSNMKYYDNKLLTFPSHNDLVSEVSIVHPEGFYDKGKTKHNKAEAKAVVAEIIRRLSDENLRNDSIGVVTFSSVQQNLIDDMLCEEWAKHPELEEFDQKSAEPIFIKNLENVQGDERDVILFSVGYGPDENGNVSMNFGPLNRDGGWRRLNVAISRARKSMIVYSVLRHEQIDLSRTRSEGVAGLKG
ncbi:MAG: DEAD/DEAH box helicase, partial [Oscillospiraceae bacterium]